jgi:hypothetical protein
MISGIEVITDIGKFAGQMRVYGEVDNPKPLLVQAVKLLAFAQAAFPDTDTDKIYAQKNEREPEGRGAHFDVYQGIIEESHPWIAVFNLAGSAAIRTTTLSPALSQSYFDIFPEPTDEAFEARRHFSAIALSTPGAEISGGTLEADTGLILPQRVGGPHIVHDIVPITKSNPGRYIKMAVPNGKKSSQERMMRGKYLPLDQLVTEQLGGNPEVKTIPTTNRTRQLPPTLHRSDCNLD